MLYDSSDNSSDDVVRRKRRKRSFSSTPKQGDKSLITTKIGKARVKSRDDYKSRPARDNVDDVSDSDSDNTHSMMRSVRSETVSNHTFSDSSSYRMIMILFFDLHFVNNDNNWKYIIHALRFVKVKVRFILRQRVSTINIRSVELLIDGEI